jgi:hypothetical protein
MAQRSEGGHSKDTYFWINDQAKLMQPLKNQVEMKLMILEVRTGNPEVI